MDVNPAPLATVGVVRELPLVGAALIASSIVDDEGGGVVVMVRVSRGPWSITWTSLSEMDEDVVVAVAVVAVVILDDVVVMVAMVNMSEPASVVSLSFLLPSSSSSSSISSSIFPLLLSCMDSTLLAAPLADPRLMVLPSRASISPALTALILLMLSLFTLMR